MLHPLIAERIEVGGPVESLVSKLSWIDIGEWNFSAESVKKTGSLKEKFPTERRTSTTSSVNSDSQVEITLGGNRKESPREPKSFGFVSNVQKPE